MPGSARNGWGADLSVHVVDSRWVEKQVAVTKVACFSRALGQAACVTAMYFLYSEDTFPEKFPWLLAGLTISVLIVAYPTLRLRVVARSTERDRWTVAGAGVLMFMATCVWLYATLGPFMRASAEEIVPHAIVVSGIACSVVLTSMYTRNVAILLLAMLLLPFAYASLRIPFEFGPFLCVLTLVFFLILSAQTSVLDVLSRKEFELTQRNADLLDANRRQTAELVSAARLASLGQMSAGVAHEINNPLAILDGLAYELRRSIDDPSSAGLEDCAEAISAEVARISSIVRGLQQISRDAVEDDFEEANLVSLVEEAVALCRVELEKLGIALSVRPSQPEIEVRARPAQVAQVVMNLVSNAIEAVSSREERWITIDVAAKESGPCVSVVDSGRGIAPEDRDRVMQPFFTTKPPGEGTGLGMSISQSIMRSHGGDLRLDPESPHTKFDMRFAHSAPA